MGKVGNVTKGMRGLKGGPCRFEPRTEDHEGFGAADWREDLQDQQDVC